MNFLHKKRPSITAIMFTLLVADPLAYATAEAADCHPELDQSQAQYVVGYGSLISEDSKKRSVQHAELNIPVNVSGYQRGWFLKGPATRYSTTFLGVKVAANEQMNGVIFKLFDSNEISALDKRENGYCRQLVEPSHIQPLTGDRAPQAQYWIYVSEPGQIAVASEQQWHSVKESLCYTSNIFNIYSD